MSSKKINKKHANITILNFKANKKKIKKINKIKKKMAKLKKLMDKKNTPENK